MPELPDITVYLEALERRVAGERLERIRLPSLFLLRTVSPAPSEVEGRKVTGLRRIGKRIVIGLEGELFLVLHLMIAGRLRWVAPGAKVPGKLGLAALDFPAGTLIITEAGTRKRASLHIVRGLESLGQFDRGGVEIADATLETYGRTLTRESHTLKRALSDPHLFSGIGNAYSDEILHRARLSPLQLTGRLSPEEIRRLYEATRATLDEWTTRLRNQTGDRFPEKVTAFREGMAVHGRFGKPCPACGAPVQRIVYVDNETNYCAHCQTGGRLLADRALSRLLKGDWPRTLEGWEGA
jgi:formamidopyrimidine-DNA glycosylase